VVTVELNPHSPTHQGIRACPPWLCIERREAEIGDDFEVSITDGEVAVNDYCDIHVIGQPKRLKEVVDMLGEVIHGEFMNLIWNHHNKLG
jgi:hypothetical protein